MTDLKDLVHALSSDRVPPPPFYSLDDFLNGNIPSDHVAEVLHVSIADGGSGEAPTIPVAPVQTIAPVRQTQASAWYARMYPKDKAEAPEEEVQANGEAKVQANGETPGEDDWVEA